MKINKKIILVLLAVFASSTLIEGWRGRGRGFRGRGYGRRGYWGRRGGWGRGYGWGWGAPAVGFALGAAAASNNGYYRDRYYRDDMNRRYWTVTNDTDVTISVKTPGRGYRSIRPGGKRQIHRGDSFRMKIKGPGNQRLRLTTEDHYVRITGGNFGGSFSYETYNK